jgi:WhiB family transcriptional regulator, redox-sensing transcriptional regulator
VTGTIEQESWQAAAACLGSDPELFFPVSGSGKCLEQIAQAKAVCAGCPVRRECLGFAQRTGQAHGVWGGLTEQERAQVKRARRDAEPAPSTATLSILYASVARATGLPPRVRWEHRAAAHAEIFSLLAECSGLPGQPSQDGRTSDLAYDLMVTVGPACHGMVLNSRQRLLGHLRARESDGAAREIEDHLRVLRFMARLARQPAAHLLAQRGAG